MCPNTVSSVDEYDDDGEPHSTSCFCAPAPARTPAGEHKHDHGGVLHEPHAPRHGCPQTQRRRAVPCQPHPQHGRPQMNTMTTRATRHCISRMRPSTAAHRHNDDDELRHANPIPARAPARTLADTTTTTMSYAVPATPPHPLGNVTTTSSQPRQPHLRACPGTDAHRQTRRGGGAALRHPHSLTCLRRPQTNTTTKRRTAPPASPHAPQHGRPQSVRATRTAAPPVSPHVSRTPTGARTPADEDDEAMRCASRIPARAPDARR